MLDAGRLQGAVAHTHAAFVGSASPAVAEGVNVLETFAGSCAGLGASRMRVAYKRRQCTTRSRSLHRAPAPVTVGCCRAAAGALKIFWPFHLLGCPVAGGRVGLHLGEDTASAGVPSFRCERAPLSLGWYLVSLLHDSRPLATSTAPRVPRRTSIPPARHWCGWCVIGTSDMHYPDMGETSVFTIGKSAALRRRARRTNASKPGAKRQKLRAWWTRRDPPDYALGGPVGSDDMTWQFVPVTMSGSCDATISGPSPCPNKWPVFL
ncbi:hypothetical protein C8R46DRAFT_388869 [Mycena filopes]|nr:hypothetical protein C8R46DRAFT_388869 [Mycena filopes]